MTVLSYEEALAAYDPVLGLEVHVELNTTSKMFCGCSTAFGAEPNTQVCPVCLGLPGSLPVVNAKAVESAIRIGLALNCTIAEWCRFARKNYFYPDMPKNYQISQYDEPIAYDGWTEVVLDGEIYRIDIERAHMEEDTGKSLHVGGATGRIHGADYSLLDYNRSGVPLIEIVTKPIEGTGAKAPEVARAYVTMLRDLLRALGVSDVRMEQGSLRCDANVSLRPHRYLDLRHPHRDQEREFAAQRRASAAVRDHSAGGRTRRRRQGHPGDAPLAGGFRHDYGRPEQGDRGGLSLFSGAGPGADRAKSRVGRGTASDTSRASGGQARPSQRRMGFFRAGNAGCGQRRCRQCDRGDGRRGRLAPVGSQVVAHRDRTACQRAGS